MTKGPPRDCVVRALEEPRTKPDHYSYESQIDPHRGLLLLFSFLVQRDRSAYHRDIIRGEDSKEKYGEVRRQTSENVRC